MPYAEVSDVEVDYGSIAPSEHDKTETLLERAEAQIREHITDLDDRITAGTLNEVLVVQVESEMVAAVLRNPNCWQSQTETVGPFSQSHTLNAQVASGLLQFTPRQQGLLGLRSRAGSIAPRIGWGDGPVPGYPAYEIPPVWTPWP